MIVQIRDICSAVYSGGTPNRKHLEYYEGGDIPWLNTSEVVFNRIYKTEKHITQSGLKNSSAKWIPENSVIVAMYGATAGRTAIAKIPLTTNQACCNLIIDPEKADYRYVYYYLYSKYQHLLSMANGGAQQNLNAGQIKEYVINLPDLQTQKKIADILDLLDSKIELNNTINNNLEQQAQALYKSWFVDFELNSGVMPSDWKVSQLGSVAKISTEVFSPAKNPNVEVEHYSIPAYDEKHYPMFETSNGIKSNKYRLTSNSVMISKLNPDTKRIWRPYCISDNPICSTEFIVYEPINPLNRDFIYSIIDSIGFSAFLCSHTTGSTNSRQRATPSITLTYDIVVPDEKTIQTFCSIVSPMYDIIENNIKEIQKLAETRDKLLPKLMSGELEVSDIEL